MGAVALWLFGLGGGEGATPGPARPAIERFVSGRGAEAALVVRRPSGRPQPGVVFLHGWGLVGPKAYSGWITHLARRGATVIVPRYQMNLRTPPEDVLDNALAGIRSALPRVDLDPGGVVVVGHSAGGALASDYAAVAESEQLPQARAVLAIYPGRAIRASTLGIPTADLTAIPPSTRLVVMASATDEIVGEGPARELLDAAVAVPPERREFVEVTDPALGDHFAPALASRRARTTFWNPLDRLVFMPDQCPAG